MTAISSKTQARVDKWESRSDVYVGFFKHYVQLEGYFQVDELSDIASIQRKRKKELQPRVKNKQKELFDESQNAV